MLRATPDEAIRSRPRPYQVCFGSARAAAPSDWTIAAAAGERGASAREKIPMVGREIFSRMRQRWTNRSARDSSVSSRGFRQPS
jgi:hypothetical protein